jgi:hypothetical protein
MRQMLLKIPVGQAVEVGAVGDYVRIKSAVVAVKVEAPDNNEFAEVEQGDALNLKKFERLRISHSALTEQDVTVLIGNGTSADSAKVGGSFAIAGAVAISGGVIVAQPTVTAAAQSSLSVTNASAQLLPARAGRKYLFIQNKSATGKIWINLTGIAASAANGVEIGPGGYYESNSAWCAPGAITAIGDLAINNDIVTVEGA